MLSPELDALIVDNLADLDAACHRLEALDREISRQLDHAVRKWADDHGWHSDCNFYDDAIRLWPAAWRDQGGDEYAWLSLKWGTGDTGERLEGEDYFLLTRLVGAGVGMAGFALEQDAMKPGAWKRAYKAALAQPNASRLPRDSEGWFYFPLRLEQAALAEAIRDGVIEEAFVQVGPTLDRIAALQEVLDTILQPVRAAAIEASAA